MKNLYLFSILLVWTLCLPAAVSAQSDGANRIAAIRARLDTLTRRDEAYLGEVDLSVGEAPLSELLRSVAQVGGVNLSVRDGANLTVSCNFTRARIDELLLFLCEQYGLDVQVIGNIVSVFPYEAPVAPPPEPSVRFDRSDSTLSYDLIAVPLREVARRITDSTGVNLIVPQALYDRPDIGLHRGDAFRGGARFAGRDQQTGNYSRERQRGMDVRRGGSPRRRRTGSRTELCPPPAVRSLPALSRQHGTHYGDDRPG